MTQYGVAAFVKGIAINCRLRLVLGHLWASPSGETRSRHLRCCASWKGPAISGETRLAANGFSSR